MQSQLSPSTTSQNCNADGGLNLYVEAEISQSTDSLPAALVKAFADATGWELARVGDEIKIVDMSSSWPARTPTVHRGKCDRFAAELSKFLLQ